MMQTLWRALSFIIPVALAAAVLIFVVQGREPPRQSPLGERATIARVMTLEPISFTPQVTGYGIVKPARVWDAVAQVPGRIAYVHPELLVGAMLPEGLEIIRIAEEDYSLAVDEAMANLEAARAALEELETRVANVRRSLDIERRSLRLKRDDLTRQQDLVLRGVASQATLDDVERDELAQQTRVQDLQNTIDLFPVQRRTLQTEIAVAEARLATARLDLERTRIRMPFRGRVSMEAVEETQFAVAGTVLATVDDVAAAEIPAQAPQDQFGQFVALATPDGFRPILDSPTDFAGMVEKLGWRADVRISSESFEQTWPARVVRTADTIDAGSRSVGVIVRVEGPYRDFRPGVRPPLVKGMFVEVTLEGRPLEGQRVLPRAAIRNGRVFVADDENRLRVREVTVRAIQSDRALIAEGLAFGERVVVSDLAAAVDGMLLDPVEGDDAPPADGAISQ